MDPDTHKLADVDYIPNTGGPTRGCSEEKEMDYREEIRNQRDENVRTKRDLARLLDYCRESMGLDDLMLEDILAGKPVALKTEDTDGQEEDQDQSSGGSESGQAPGEESGLSGIASGEAVKEESDAETEQAGEDQTDERPEASQGS